MPEINDIKISKNFYLKDFQCPCCKKVIIHPSLLDEMEKLSAMVKGKIKITSGYRCEKHNKEVGGVPNSKHMKRLACDITATDLQEVYNIAKKLKFSFVKLDEKKKYIHMEV